jgi:hypothetical protein
MRQDPITPAAVVGPDYRLDGGSGELKWTAAAAQPLAAIRSLT